MAFADPEREKEYQREKYKRYYAEKKAEIQAKRKEFYSLNPLKRKRINRRYYAKKNPDSVITQKRKRLVIGHLKWKAKNKEAYQAYMRDWFKKDREKNGEKYRQMSLKSYYRTKSARLEYCQKRNKFIAENLTDYYVKKAIIGYTEVKLEEIPLELIELKRSVILAKRLLKQSTNN